MTSKDKTPAANVVRKFPVLSPVLSKEVESTIANELSDDQVLIKTTSEVRITAVGLNLRNTVLFSDNLHSHRL